MAEGGAYRGARRIAGGLVAEVQGCASGEGFRTLERSLGDQDLLILRRDYADPLVLMPWEVYQRLTRNQFPGFEFPDFEGLDWPDLPDQDFEGWRHEEGKGNSRGQIA